jgi:hypothetical protein
MKKLSIYLSAVLVMLVGCAKDPVVPEYYLDVNDRIGYVIQGSDKVSHVHSGTTIFNDIDKSYSTSWNFEKEIENAIKKYVRGEVINLKEYDVSSSQVKNLFTTDADGWKVKDSRFHKELLYIYDVKAIILIEQDETVVSEFKEELESSGLFSKHTLGFKRYIGVNAYKVKLYVLNPNTIVPIRNHKNSVMLYHSLYSSYQEKSGFNKPRDIENITEKELLPLKHSILKLLEETIKSIN